MVKTITEKWTIRKILLVVISFLRLSVYAETCYISSIGNDTKGDGSINSPWKSLYKACEQIKTPGDTIYVLAGTYFENRQCNLAAGVSIKGEGIVSLIKSNLSTAFQVTIILHSNKEGTNGNQSISNIKMDGCNLTAWGAIQINGRSNVSIHDCYFVDFLSTAVIFNAAYTYVNNEPKVYATENKFFNNVIINCSEHPFGIDNSSGALQIGGQDGMSIFKNHMTQTGRPAGQNGFVIKYYSNGYNKNLKIHNNTIIKEQYSGYDWDYDFAVELWHCRGGIEIFENRIIGAIDFGGSNGDCVVKGDYDYGVFLHNNHIGPDTLRNHRENGIYLELGITDVIISRNYFQNMNDHIILSPGSGHKSFNVSINYNIFKGVGIDAAGWNGYGIRYYIGTTGSEVEDLNIFNNVFYAGEDQDQNLAAIGIPAVGLTRNVNIRNNIIVGFDLAPVYSDGKLGQIVENLIIENNILYRNANRNKILLENLTPANYTNSDNIKGNPKFLDRDDFHLSRWSPGIKKGQTMDDLLIDFDGIRVGTPPNIGCFETTGEKYHSIVRKYVKPAGLGFLLILVMSLSTWIIYKHRSSKR